MVSSGVTKLRQRRHIAEDRKFAWGEAGHSHVGGDPTVPRPLVVVKCQQQLPVVQLAHPWVDVLDRDQLGFARLAVRVVDA